MFILKIISKIKKRYFIFVGLFLVITNPIYSGETVKIGLVADLSGIIKTQSQDIINGANIAIEEINKKGGVNGKTVELIVMDGTNNPEQHFKLVQELARQSDVSAILGGGISPNISRGSDAARKEQIPYLIVLGNSEYITVQSGHPYVFQFQPNSAMETYSWAIFMTLMPWKRYAWIGPDYRWGHEVYEDFFQYFDQSGVAIDLVSTQWHPLGIVDYNSIVDKLIEEKPEILILGSFADDIINFYKTAKEKELFNEVNIFGRFPEIISNQVGDIIPKGIWAPSRAPFKYLADKYEIAGKFINRYIEEHASYPLITALTTYDAVIAWSEAAELAGSFNRQNIADSMRNITFEGVRGKSYIRPIDGQLNCPTYFGMLKFDPQYGSSVLESVIEVKAEQVWLSPEKIRTIRNLPNE